MAEVFGQGQFVIIRENSMCISVHRMKVILCRQLPILRDRGKPLHCVKAEKGWDDCCPFFDDDGQLYFVGTHFADKYKTYLYRMTPDGKTLIENSKILINEGMVARQVNFIKSTEHIIIFSVKLKMAVDIS